MSWNLSLRFKIATTLFVLFAVSSWAQTFRAKVEGIVTDESKAVVVGASVTVLNVNTGIKVTHQTNAAGLYLFDNVDPGTYSVTVEMAGFNKFIQEKHAL